MITRSSSTQRADFGDALGGRSDNAGDFFVCQALQHQECDVVAAQIVGYAIKALGLCAIGP